VKGRRAEGYATDQRNREIVAARAAGARTSDIARRLGVSRQRVDQIVHAEQHKARQAVHDAVANGKLTKPARCESCQSTNPLESHHEDYSKPLVVVWLCHRCHRRADSKKQRPLIAARRVARIRARRIARIERKEARRKARQQRFRVRWMRALEILKGFVRQHHRAPSYPELASLVLGRPMRNNGALVALSFHLGRDSGHPRYWLRVKALYRLAGVAPRGRGTTGHVGANCRCIGCKYRVMREAA
jgi:Homeodomain-like domain